jgi:hypothetical protein
LHWKSDPHPTLGDIPSKMVREAAQDAINAIFDTEKNVNSVPLPQVSVGVSSISSTQSVTSSGPVPRYEGFGNSTAVNPVARGMVGISGGNNFEEDRSILSYASTPPAYTRSNTVPSRMTGFGSSNGSGHSLDGSKGIEKVKQVGAKAASLLTAGYPATGACSLCRISPPITLVGVVHISDFTNAQASHFSSQQSTPIPFSPAALLLRQVCRS